MSRSTEARIDQRRRLPLPLAIPIDARRCASLGTTPAIYPITVADYVIAARHDHTVSASPHTIQPVPATSSASSAPWPAPSPGRSTHSGSARHHMPGIGGRSLDDQWQTDAPTLASAREPVEVVSCLAGDQSGGDCRSGGTRREGATSAVAGGHLGGRSSGRRCGPDGLTKAGLAERSRRSCLTRGRSHRLDPGHKKARPVSRETGRADGASGHCSLKTTTRRWGSSPSLSL